MKFLLYSKRGIDPIGEAIKLNDIYSVIFYKQIRLTQYLTENELKKYRKELIK